MKSHDNTVSNSTSNSDQNLITTDDQGIRLNIGTNDIYVAIFAALLASFPIRSMSIWGHLANGRDLWGGKLSKLTPTWMYDFANYLAYHAFGEVAIAGVKVLMVVAMAVILFHTSRLSNGSIGRRIALACTVLATLAASMRFLAQPATVSYLFLAIAISLVWRKAQGANREIGRAHV